jgi:hypothetical protein
MRPQMGIWRSCNGPGPMGALETLLLVYARQNSGTFMCWNGRMTMVDCGMKIPVPKRL